MTYMASNYFATGDPPTRMGSKHPTIAPYQAFATNDGYVVVAVASENLWPNFCTALDREDLTDDERFATNEDRVANREALDALLAEELAEYDTDELLTLFDEHDVPASDVHDMADVFTDEQVAARGMHREIEHPTAGTVEMPGSPMHFSHTPTTIRQYPPRLGEHTRDLLHEAGYDTSEIQELIDADAVAPFEN